ncbi:MAG TPA: glycogen/starch synthase [Polyangia bacterium]|nr:glycogen/starch synthase [Polyangia bacterium]
MNLLHIATKVTPYTQGGSAGAVGGLTRALAALGESVALVAPRGEVEPDNFGLARRLRTVTVPLGSRRFELTVFEGRLPAGRGEVRTWLLDHPVWQAPRQRAPGAGGASPPGQQAGDPALGLALLSRAADLVARTFGFEADVLHAHDGETALSLFEARRNPEQAGVHTVLTIHQVARTAELPRPWAEALEMQEALGWTDGVGQGQGQGMTGGLDLLALGIRSADRVATVSPRYAQEIQTAEYGQGLEDLLRAQGDRLVGILGGIDADVWNPERDPLLAAPYEAGEITGKRACKAALQRQMSLPDKPRTPLTGLLLDRSAGAMELLLAVLPGLLGDRDVQVVILATGTPAEVEPLVALARRFPARLAVRVNAEEALAHTLYAGADLLLVPSRDDPSGLAALPALRYGAVPIVRNAGGLADAVMDYDPRSKTGTGFKFTAYTTEALDTTWRRALSAYGSDEGWPLLVRHAMSMDVSWAPAARAYQKLYRSIYR